MVNKHQFPPELLDQPPVQRLLYFKNPRVTFMHRNLKIAFDKSYRTIIEPAGASIILVIGPSGVGKSTLLFLLAKKIIEKSLLQMEANPGWIPFIGVEAPAPGKGTFRWKNFYRIILEAIDEPGIDQKIYYNVEGIRRDGDGKLVFRTKQATEDAMRLAMEKALIHRKPYTLAVDEFQHIGKMASEEVLQAHMDCVKSAVNVTKIPWTGFGTYQLLNFLDLSPQLSRRTKVIQFPRYHLDKDEDIKEFRRVLKHFQYRLPLLKTPALEQKCWEFCYERSIGNIGTLKDWLTDAYDLALSENATTLSFDHLKETAKSASECEQMALEAIEGETKLTDNKEKSNSLRVVLGFQKDESQTQNQVSSNDIEKTNNSEKHKTTQPFQRNPKRDPVGD
ncbi:AAA family ATPase [uncultured Nostoc sp.]|uniref:AAA family ATPase n=1 Tax=uncultured Nostoc sp. TaxID=340711 RepID=UPI0035C96A38